MIPIFNNNEKLNFLEGFRLQPQNQSQLQPKFNYYGLFKRYIIPSTNKANALISNRNKNRFNVYYGLESFLICSPYYLNGVFNQFRELINDEVDAKGVGVDTLDYGEYFWVRYLSDYYNPTEWSNGEVWFETWLEDINNIISKRPTNYSFDLEGVSPFSSIFTYSLYSQIQYDTEETFNLRTMDKNDMDRTTLNLIKENNGHFYITGDFCFADILNYGIFPLYGNNILFTPYKPFIILFRANNDSSNTLYHSSISAMVINFILCNENGEPLQ